MLEKNDTPKVCKDFTNSIMIAVQDVINYTSNHKFVISAIISSQLGFFYLNRWFTSSYNKHKYEDYQNHASELANLVDFFKEVKKSNNEYLTFSEQGAQVIYKDGIFRAALLPNDIHVSIFTHKHNMCRSRALTITIYKWSDHLEAANKIGFMIASLEKVIFAIEEITSTEPVMELYKAIGFGICGLASSALAYHFEEA